MKLKEMFPYFLISAISAVAFMVYVPKGLNLPYADSISRLDMARKVVDNITPGIAQLGSVWLPLPQILMVPFIWNDYLWHSGIAGAIMSMTAFIIGGIYVFKSVRLVTESYSAGILSLLVYGLNINLLYLQTTAMSETLFVCLLAVSVYYLLAWIKTSNWQFLIPAGLAISGLTLTRYEGLPVLASSLLLVLVCSWVKYRNFSKVEGLMLIFTAAACFGFFLWTLYLTAIFGDPLFWIRYYATAQTQTVGTTVIKTYSQNKPFLTATWEYFTSVVWMSGVIPVLFALYGIPMALVLSLKSKRLYFMPLLMPASVFLFMVLTLQRNTPVVQPGLSLTNLLTPNTSLQTGFNIRYGLIVHSWIAILAGCLFGVKKYRINLLVFSVFMFQVAMYFYPQMTLVYQIPAQVYGKPYGEIISWFKKNYRGGPILVSASGFEDQMFELGFPYKYYIHEGTNKYWKEALDYPALYASYVVFDRNHSDDRLGKELKNKPYWSWFYNLVYDSDHGQIYEVKTKPDLTISGIPAFVTRPIPPSPFLTRDGNKFMLNGQPFPYHSVDETDIATKPSTQIASRLDAAIEQGATVIRVWAFGEGIAVKNLELVLAEAKKRNLYVLFVLANYDGSTGAIPQFLTMDGLPSLTAKQKDAFFTNEFTKNRYREQLSHIIVSPLATDTSLVGWELMNQPQISDAQQQSVLTGWFNEMTGVVRHFDPNHLVFTGDETPLL